MSKVGQVIVQPFFYLLSNRKKIIVMDSWNLYQIIYFIILFLAFILSTVDSDLLFNRTENKRTQKSKNKEHRTSTLKNIK